GFLSIGTQQAVVQLTQKPIDPNDQIIDGRAYKAQDLHGKIWIENGCVYTQISENDEFDQDPPTLTATDGITIIKNGEIAADTIEVRNGDGIEFQTEDEETQTSWDIILNHSKMNALLIVRPGRHVTRSIPNMK